MEYELLRDMYCRYEPLFNYFMEFSDAAFRVLSDNYVTDDSGTGIVHCAPAFGEDDYRVCVENQIIDKVCTQMLKNADHYGLVFWLLFLAWSQMYVVNVALKQELPYMVLASLIIIFFFFLIRNKYLLTHGKRIQRRVRDPIKD